MHLNSSLVSIDLSLDLWIVPALEIKKSKGIVRGKNDKTDAKDISFYSYRNIDKLKLFQPIEKDIQKLKLLYTEREKVLKSLLLLEKTKENYSFTSKDVYKEIASVNQSLINTLKKAFIKAISYYFFFLFKN